MTLLAPYVSPRMYLREILVLIVYVTYVAATVISHRNDGR